MKNINTKVSYAFCIVGAVCLGISIILALISALSIAMLIFGFFMFGITGNIMYFPAYIALHGYIPEIQLLFIIDYLGLFIGSNSILYCLLSLITMAIGWNSVNVSLSKNNS